MPVAAPDAASGYLHRAPTQPTAATLHRPEDGDHRTPASEAKLDRSAQPTCFYRGPNAGGHQCAARSVRRSPFARIEVSVAMALGRVE